jgi:Holliday junction resolvasome RuvABC endonuclease subunit
MSCAYNRNDKRVLAIDPSTRGFGYAILEGPDRLIDWGVKETRADKNRRALILIAELLEIYQPKVLVIEDYSGRGSRRCQRIQMLVNDISKLALKRKVKVRSFSRAKVQQSFAQLAGRTKYEIAMAIAKRFPELAPRLPRFRKPWMSEDYRMSIFDAGAFGLTFFAPRNKQV